MTPFFTARSPGQAQLLRFLLAGVVNTLFGLAIYSALIVAGLPIWGALVAGNVAGIGFNFITTGGYVFRSLGWSRLPRFVAAYLAVYGINLAAIHGLAHWVPHSIAAQALLTPPMAVLSYLLMKHCVFVTARP